MRTALLVALAACSPSTIEPMPVDGGPPEVCAEEVPALAGCVVTWELERPGYTPALETGTIQYDAFGLVAQVLDFDQVRRLTYERTVERDHLGRVLTERIDENGDGILEESTSIQWSGCLEDDVTQDLDDDGTSDVRKQYTYDHLERLVRIESTPLEGADGELAEAWTVTIEYDGDLQIERRDWDGNGIVDEIRTDLVDDQDRLVWSELDQGGDGTVEVRIDIVWVGDDWASQTLETFDGYEGDERDRRLHQTVTPDLVTQYVDYDLDGTTDRETRYGYDDLGRIVRIRRDEYPQAEFEADTKWTYSYACEPIAP